MTDPDETQLRVDAPEPQASLLARLEENPSLTLSDAEAAMVASSPKLTRLLRDYRAGLLALDLFRSEPGTDIPPDQDCTLVDGIPLEREADPNLES